MVRAVPWIDVDHAHESFESVLRAMHVRNEIEIRKEDGHSDLVAESIGPTEFPTYVR